MPDPRLLKAHAVIAQIWNDLDMEPEFENIARFLDSRQFAMDGTTEIPRSCAVM